MLSLKTKNNIILRGYTLIELLMVIAITSIVSTVIINSFSTSRIKGDLDAAGREVVTIMRQAQNDALTGRQYIANKQPCRFQVSWDTSTYTNTFWYLDASGVCNTSSVIKSYTLKNNTVFSSTDNLYFTPPHGTAFFTNAAAASSATEITKEGSSQVVCVYATGLINSYVGSTCP